MGGLGTRTDGLVVGWCHVPYRARSIVTTAILAGVSKTAVFDRQPSLLD